MAVVSDPIKRQISDPRPDVEAFLGVMQGTVRPKRVHLGELFADDEVMAWVYENVLGKKWVAIRGDFSDPERVKAHYLCEIDYWYRMGYDYIWVSEGVSFPGVAGQVAENTAALAKHKRGWANMQNGPIQSWADYEKYRWPEVKGEDLWHYEFVAENLPQGMGIMVCPHGGFLEIPSDWLIGYESLALLSHDEPDLVKAVFDRTREVVVSVYEQLLDYPRVVGAFQGDDMGYKTGLLMPPDFLKTHALVGHKQVAEMAHARGQAYFMHSCGQLDDIMDELIDEVGIDVRHSYEDVITPVEEFYAKYGRRVGVMGGLDVDLLARADEQTVRRRSREILDACAGGRYAFGSGNTVANYCRPENVLAMFEEAYCWGR